MPIDYSKYPKNWKSEIRPAILQRANNKCEVCGVENNMIILRGIWNGVECYQDCDGLIYDAANGECIDSTYLGEVHPTNKLIRIVLTIAHLDHDVANNSYDNLKAMCQKCHLNYDKEHHANTRRRNRKQLQLEIM